MSRWDRRWRWALLILAGGAAVVQSTDRLPTPEIDRFEVVEGTSQVAYVMRGQLGNTGHYVGLALVCGQDGPSRLEITVFFSGFPHTRQPVRLAVQDAGGRVERFGPLVKGGPESGFHSPRLTDREEVERFVGIALKPGSLVSNGYRSFWNRVSEAENKRVAESFLGCAGGRE